MKKNRRNTPRKRTSNDSLFPPPQKNRSPFLLHPAFTENLTGPQHYISAPRYLRNTTSPLQRRRAIFPIPKTIHFPSPCKIVDLFPSLPTYLLTYLPCMDPRAARILISL